MVFAPSKWSEVETKKKFFFFLSLTKLIFDEEEEESFVRNIGDRD